MTCSACSAHVEKAVGKLEGVGQVSVSLLTNSMTVDYDGEKLSDREIIAAVEDAGYGASEAESAAKRSAGGAPAPDPNARLADEIRQMKTRVAWSFVFLIPLFYISMGHMMGLPLPHFMHGNANAAAFAFTQFLLCLPIVYLNRKYFQVGFKTLWKRSPNMDSLIAIGSAAALAYGVFAIYQIGYGLGHGDAERVSRYSMDLYFESAAMILTLITLGKFLEIRSRGKTSEAIQKLMDLAPKTAVVLRDGAEIEIPIEEVAVGDLLVVRPGQSVPVDGVITEGESSLDESALTGESIPVQKAAGDRVSAAAINKTGSFTFRAEKVGDDTTLAQIIRLVEEASASKAPIAKLADKISGVFVPTVILIALAATAAWLFLGASFTFALSIGIAVLVISCPCALGLATPVAIMVGTGKGAENGILIKSAEALETLHAVDTVVMDKTGTITNGKPQVTDVLVFGAMTADRLVSIAASMEKPSEHPLAEAVVEYAAERGAPLWKVTQFEAVSGQGIRASIDGARLLAGNLRMMQENGVSVSEAEQRSRALADEGKTPLYFADENGLIGLIAVADVAKPTSRGAIQAFESMGIDVVMLTGDNRRTAEVVGRELGVTKVIAEVLPEDKESKIRALQEEGKKVAMIGDGINDAPALARADVGVAIGAGTDVAIESADIVLMKSDLADAVTAVELSRAVIRNIRENLFWAFFYNTIGIPVAAGLLYPMFHLTLNPMIAAAAMSLSSVCVVSNALRLKFFKGRAAGFTADETDGNGNTAKAAPAEPKYERQIKGGSNMKKTIMIEGMSCGHCSARVEKALNALDGVEAKVNLEAKSAEVTLSKEVPDGALRKAVEDAGYEVKAVE